MGDQREAATRAEQGKIGPSCCRVVEHPAVQWAAHYCLESIADGLVIPS